MNIKKLLSLVVTTILTLTFVGSNLVGCKDKENIMTANGIYDEKISNGEWLQILNQKFGFTVTNSDTQYFDNISESNPYYKDVQIAVDMEILPIDYENLELDQDLSREFCAITLAGAVYLENNDNVYIEDIDDCSYPEKVKSVVNHGVMGLDDDNNFQPKEIVLYVEAAANLERAFEVWVGYTFEETVYEYTINENVVDLAGISTISQIENNEFSMDESFVETKKDLMEDIGFKYNTDTGDITVNDIERIGIEKDSVIVIPDATEMTGINAIKVLSIVQLEDGSYLIETDNAELIDVYKELEYQDTIIPDLQNCILYDENGNPIEYETESVSEQLSYAGNDCAMVLDNNHNGNIVMLDNELGFEFGNGTKKFNVKVGDYSAAVSISNDDVTVSLKSSDTVNNLEKNNAGLSMKLSDITITNVVDAGVFKGLKYYKGSIDFDYSGSLTIDKSLSTKKQLFTTMIPTTVPGVYIKLTISIKFSLSGEVSLSTSIDNWEMGMEFRNNNLSYIYHHDTPQHDLIVKAVAEATFPVRFSAVIISEKVASVYLEAEFGLGAEGECETNTVEFPGEVPYEIECVGVDIYILASISAGVKLVKWEPKATWNIAGKDNATFASVHIENLKFVGKCTAEQAEKARKEAAKEAQKEEKGQAYAAEKGITVSDNFLLDNSTIEIEVGEECSINISECPAKYLNVSEMYITTTNTEVLEVHNAKEFFIHKFLLFKSKDNDEATYLQLTSEDIGSLKFTGRKAGATLITFQTKDTKYTASCLILVNAEGKKSGGNSSLSLKETFITIAPSAVYECTVMSMPEGISKEDLVWESDDTSIADVSNGYISAKGIGITTITVRTNDNNYYYKVTVNVDAGGLKSNDLNTSWWNQSLKNNNTDQEYSYYSNLQISI